jgi:hypothetical protein
VGTNNNALQAQSLTRCIVAPVTAIIRAHSAIDIQPNNINHIARLPSELLNQLFQILRPADSLCLGLTCYRLYIIHMSIYHKQYSRISHYPQRSRLPCRLRAFIPSDLTYCREHGKFVTENTLKQVQEENEKKAGVHYWALMGSDWRDYEYYMRNIPSYIEHDTEDEEEDDY